MLALCFLARFNEENGRSVRGFSVDALAAISAHGWPGNVREMENKVKRAVIMCDGKRITPEDLDLATPPTIPKILSLAEARDEAERRAIPRALSQVDGNITRAAKMLGVSRPTLYDLMRQHNIEVDC